jgi:hypothetical protein
VATGRVSAVNIVIDILWVRLGLNLVSVTTVFFTFLIASLGSTSPLVQGVINL